MGEACPQMENTDISRARKEEKQPNANKASNVQARTIKGVFMFGRAAHTIKETKRPLPALPELPSHQDHGGDKEDTAKKPRITGPDLENSGWVPGRQKGLTTWIILPRRAGELR